MNRICLVGRITKDLELRETTSGKSKCEFNLAVNRDKDNADFITVQVWKDQAINLCQYQKKGSLIGVEGQLRVVSFDKADGTKGYKTYVLASKIEYLSSKETIEEKKVEKVKEEDKSDPFAEFGEMISVDDNFLE